MTGIWGLLADILFVGHSLIGLDLPVTVQGGLRAAGDPSSVAAQVIIGAPLKFNYEHSAEAQGVDGRVELQKAETDVLIVTEAIPLAEHLKWNDTPGQIARFADLARVMNSDVRVFLYETWHSRKSGPGTQIEGDRGAGIPWRERLTADLPLWEGAVHQANALLGSEIVQLLPAGQAMGLLADEVAAGRVPGISNMGEFFSDDIHLSEKGEYFVALVHLAAIRGQSPEGLPTKLTRSWRTRDGVVSDDLAASLQRIAWKAVSTYKPSLPQAALIEPAQTVAVPEPTVAPTAEPVVASPKLLDSAGFTPITNPNLALGLHGITDWTVQQPFLNVLKTAREWTGHLPGQFGGWDHARLSSAGVLDENGWPKSIPPELTGLSLLFLTDLPSDAEGVSGRYLVTFEGKGDLTLEGLAQNVQANGNEIRFDFVPGPGTVSLTLTRTDATDPIRNITVVREDRAALLAEGKIFNPDWLNRLRGVKTLRFMDWMKTNDSPLANLSDRPKPNDYTWSRLGAPIEVIIALANELDANPWLTIPHLAKDDLVRFYATTVKDSLDPALNAHVEFSNEVWNWQFAQAAWAEEQGRALWGGESRWVQYYALRAAQVADIWAEVYGDAAQDRLTRILATQTGWLGLEEQILSAPEIIATGSLAPSTHFDAYAVTGYFSGLLGSPEKASALNTWLDASETAAKDQAKAQALTGAAEVDYISRHRFDAAVAQAIAEIETGTLTGEAADTLDRLLTDILPYHAKVASDHDLRLMMYEGGTHVVGYGPAVEDARLTAFFTHLNYTPEMAALYERLLNGWSGLTPEPFNAFVDVASPSQWGSWGALRHLGDENPRWQVLAKGCLSC
ncbi:hypothetical protein ACSBLW_11730 [Thioclava sp. FR2]|uniref:hypothetical protein n=1 Tax=Thioclava sp. FR2 TaxID=3445780 RepID=UPI003EB9DA42